MQKNHSEELREKIKKKKVKIGIIGLGYVGLPLAILFADKGFSVTGFVRNIQKAESIKKGERDISKNQQSILLKAFNDGLFSINKTSVEKLQLQDVIIVCVPTPIDSEKKPDLSDLKEVVSFLSQVDLSSKLIINESTVAPFTTRTLFGGFNGNYYLVCSPERVDPGNLSKTTETIPKLVGGINEESSLLGKILYSQILKSDPVIVETLEVAEMSKMLENTYRAVNVSLINEFAKLADACSIDIIDVIKAASTKWSFQAHYPGIGTGGHCIPVDPYYVLSLGKAKGINMDVVADALRENEEMPRFILKKIQAVYKPNKKILIYGLAYKKNIKDIRESPVITLCNLLKEKGISFSVYEPLIEKEKVIQLGFSYGELQVVDIFVVGTDHDELSADYKKVVTENTIVIDARNFFKIKVGKKVIGVGRFLS